MSLLEPIRRIVHRSVQLSALNFRRGQLLSTLGIRRHQSGSTLLRIGVPASIAYTLGCFEDYLRYGGVEPGYLAGKHVIEVGPGDSLGVALCFLAHGAASVTTLDRFHPDRDQDLVARVHAGMLERLPEKGRGRARAALEAFECGATDGPLRCLQRVSIERAARQLPAACADLIVSRAVLEHVYDLDAAWASMNTLLRPGGRMWHKVDLRAHGFFDWFHPLRFLCFGDRAWERIASPDPTINRARRHVYSDLCARANVRTKVLVTHVLGRDEILPHVPDLVRGVHYGEGDVALLAALRPRLAPRFRDLTDEELLVTGIFLTTEAWPAGRMG